METLFTSDPHLGHRNIHMFRDCVSSENNARAFMAEARQRMNKRTVTWFLGDVAFDYETLLAIKALPGRKKLVKGNHDDMISTAQQLEVFEEIYGMVKFKEFWITHCPIHPDELRGKRNIHGHVHSATIMNEGKTDPRYINICPENLSRYFISLEEIRSL